MGKILSEIEEFLLMRSALSSIFCLIRANIALSLSQIQEPVKSSKDLCCSFLCNVSKSNEILLKALCQNFSWTINFTNHRGREGSKFCLNVNTWINMYFGFYLMNKYVLLWLLSNYFWWYQTHGGEEGKRRDGEQELIISDNLLLNQVMTMLVMMMVVMTVVVMTVVVVVGENSIIGCIWAWNCSQVVERYDSHGVRIPDPGEDDELFMQFTG